MDRLKIIVASTNPVKIEAARRGFALIFSDAELDVTGVSVASGVSDQPMTNAETLRGAFNRADNARTAHSDADYWVGIEGGVEEMDGTLTAFAWIVALSHEQTGYSRTGTFILPEEVTRLVRDGLELGDADDQVFGRSNSKQQNGSVGILTGDVIDRTDFYAPAVTMALIPFINPGLTFPVPGAYLT